MAVDRAVVEGEPILQTEIGDGVTISTYACMLGNSGITHKTVCCDIDGRKTLSWWNETTEGGIQAAHNQEVEYYKSNVR